MACYNWSFNGLFAKRQFYVDLSNMRTPSGSAIRPEDEEVDITSISVHPLRFSKPEVYDYLLTRGSKFWSCRKKRIIAYHDPDLDGEDGTKGVSPYSSSEFSYGFSSEISQEFFSWVFSWVFSYISPAASGQH
jgi:hypothetical protein